MIGSSTLMCASCAWENPGGSRFCNRCGLTLDPEEAPALPDENGHGPSEPTLAVAGRRGDPLGGAGVARTRASARRFRSGAVRLATPRVRWQPPTLAPLTSRAAGSIALRM